jgi:F-type H+-transporting ATPase subunit O
MRSLSTAAVDHAPKIKLFGIPARYANATYVVASEANKLDAVEKDLLAFREVIKRNKEFQAYLSNPTISRNEKVAEMEGIFDDKRNSDISKRLFTTMAANARLKEAVRVIDAFSELMRARRGEVDVIVTLAEPLTDVMEKSLLVALKKQVGEGVQIVLTIKVDSSLIGGLTVQIGDRFMDLSIAAKIKQAKNTLTGSIA